jgi:uncharacterized membrane protein
VEQDGEGKPVDANLVFAVGLTAAALTLLLLCEHVFLRDVFGNRMNTVFKLTYQAWTFLAVASAFGLYYVYTASGPALRVFGTAAVGVTLAAAAVYVPLSLGNRTAGFTVGRTLDGLAFVERTNAGSYAAVEWLWAETAGRTVNILEASGPQYQAFALMSSRTGLPTLLGWAGHEGQWRGSLPVFGERQRIIDDIYRAPDKTAVLPLLSRQRVAYVIVGPSERSIYSSPELDAFARTLPVAFEQGNVTIYRVPGVSE